MLRWHDPSNPRCQVATWEVRACPVEVIDALATLVRHLPTVGCEWLERQIRNPFQTLRPASKPRVG
jgi:hypothetical protein